MDFIRNEIERIVKEHQIDRRSFFEVSKTSYEQIQRKTENTFVDKSKHWDAEIHWANLGNYNPKLSSVNVVMDDWSTWMAELPNIIPSSDNSMYVLFEGDSKYWLYEAFLSELIFILGEINGLDDFYIVSKKFDWLISLNHHDVITYVGDNLKVNNTAV